MSSFSKAIILMVVLVALIAQKALACGMCAFAAFDSNLPPIYYWCAIIVIWFIAIVALSFHFKFRVLLITNLTIAIIAIITGLVIGFALLGPISILPLAIPPFVSTIIVLAKTRKDNNNTRERKPLLLVSIVVVLLIAAGFVWRHQIMNTRTDAQMYLKWRGTMTGRALQMKFRQQEPASINEYRYIVDHGQGYEVSDAARRIGIIGDPKVDTPRLMNAMMRVEGVYKQAIKEAIDSLSLREKRKGGPEHDKPK